jgi:chromosome segregation ATPase
MLSMDLKAHKESVSSCKEALQSLRKDLSSELKRHAPALQALQEHESERAAAADALAKRSNKIHELYSAERTKMHRDGEAACALVEDVELQIVTLRNALAGSEALETLQHKQMEQEALLAEQLASMRAANLAEEQALKQMLADSLQQMENHKADVKDRLQQKVAAAQTIRGQIAEINANVYNLDLNHTQ